MRRMTIRGHADLQICAVRSWPREHVKEAPHLTLSATDKIELGRLAQIVEYKTAGSLIFSQGSEAAYLYLLASGVVRTYHVLNNGERQVLAFHWPGDLFGLAENGKYLDSSETIASSKVYRFPVGRLEQFLLMNPNIQEIFLVKAVHDLRNTQRQLIVMGRLDIPRRLAAFLLDCSAHERYFDHRANILTLPMNRYDIADYLGTSAETVTRALSRLESEGMVRRVTARKIELKPSTLKAFVNFD
ncbi:Crp/Fnr family transcriptional regulator [Methyloferula stellata]|uniref:Crp/Fnr family transcriptional regulator n=1 Tax=Methyloferula stellata TaxID=876270 RepID=UPI0003627651|nr:Crp/Fnr family transcriptional regulator [Methyloferula stellata]